MAKVGSAVIELRADASPLQNALRRAEADTKKFVGSASANVAQFTAAFRTAGAAIAAVGLGLATTQILKTTASFESARRGLEAVTGSAAAAKGEMNFLARESNRLGLDLLTTTKSFTSFLAATKGTVLQGEESRRIFSAVSGAMAVLGKTSEETEGALMAIQQMISKGSVQAEELRGQLGERLPGAFQLAAQAMGVTTFQLNKMLEQGQVGIELLPKLATILEQRYGGAAKNGITGLTAAWNRLNTAAQQTQNAIGEGPLSSAVERLLNQITGALNDNQDSARRFGEILAGVFDSATKAVSDFRTGAQETFGGEIKRQLDLFVEGLDRVVTAYEKWLDLSQAIQNVDKTKPSMFDFAFGDRSSRVTAEYDRLQAERAARDKANAERRRGERQAVQDPPLPKPVLDGMTPEAYAKQAAAEKGAAAELKRRQKATKDLIDDLTQEKATLGLLNLEKEISNNLHKAGVTAASAEGRQIAQLTREVDSYTKALERQKAQKELAGDVLFESQQLRRGEVDRGVYSTMRGSGLLDKNGEISEGINRQIADQIRWNEEVARTQEAYRGLGSEIVSASRKGDLKGVGQSILDRTQKLVDDRIGQSIDDGISGLISSVMGPGAGVGKLGTISNPMAVTIVGGAGPIANALGLGAGGDVTRAPLAAVNDNGVNARVSGAFDQFKSVEMAAAAKAIKTIESGGNYSALGPATRTGDRAYGAYQVMGANVGPWSEKHFGQRLTPDQFRANPQAQDAVFNGEFGRLSSRYGPEGASRAWFAGEGGMNRMAAKDVVGTNVGGYGSRFGQLYNQNLTQPPALDTAALQQQLSGLQTATQQAATAIPNMTQTAAQAAPALGGVAQQAGGVSNFFQNLFSGSGGGTGGAAGGAGGGIGSSIGSFLGFDDGGYTGPGGKKQPAGVVHKGEVVFSQSDIARNGGVGNVESIRRGISRSPQIIAPVIAQAAPASSPSRKTEVNFHGAPEGTRVEETNDDQGERFDVFFDKSMAKTLTTPGGKTARGMRQFYGASPQVRRR